MTSRKDIRTLRHLHKDAEASYVLLYKEHFGMVRHLVCTNSGSDEDAKDLFQEAVIGLFEMSQRKGFKLKSKLSTLLYSIARNLWLKELRGTDHTQRFKDCESYITVDIEEYDTEKEQRIVLMEKEIENMGEPCRGLLTGFYYFKKSMTDLAAEFSYATADHAKAQKYKCLKRLKKIAMEWN